MKKLAIVVLVVFSLANFSLVCRADEHSDSDPLAAALEKRKVLREKLKQAYEEYAPIKAEVEKPDKSPSEGIEMQYKLKKLTLNLNQLKAELKENNKEIQSAYELVDIKNLAKASLKQGAELEFFLTKHKLIHENQDALIEAAIQSVFAKNSSDNGLFFGPKYVIDTVPGSFALDKSKVKLIDLIGRHEEMAMMFSIMKNKVNQVFIAYREYHLAKSEPERERARKKLVYLAGAKTVDDVLKDNR